MPMVNDELDAWLSLAHRPGLGRAAVRKLLAAFGSAQHAIDASPAAVRGVLGARAAEELCSGADPGHPARVDAARAWLARSGAHRIVTLGDPDYPEPLLQSADPPLLLYLDGRAEAWRGPSLAIVGSRQATAQGRLNARAFAREMARRGWTIVSGLASGIDAAAHEGALDGGGRTVAVIGTGIEQVYPASNRALARRIVGDGLIVSEFPLGTPPLPAHFPLRNRLIATLSRGTLVIEATLQSGSLITARLAAEAGREVFAIPGSIHSPQSRGCHALLRQGAKLVETIDDLLDELAPPAAGRAGGPRRGAETAVDAAPPVDPVLRALGHDPATLDALMARCGWPADALNARLLELELAGQIARLPGGLFQRIVAT